MLTRIILTLSTAFLTAAPALANDQTGNFLSEEDEQLVIDGFDNICPDTFCGGDLNYYARSVSCYKSIGTCVLEFKAQPYYEEDAYAEDELKDRDVSDLFVAGESDRGPFAGLVRKMITDEDGVWAVFQCRLKGGYTSPADLIEEENRGRAVDVLTDKIYGHFLDCLRKVEPVLYSL